MLAHLKVPLSWSEIAKRTLKEFNADNALDLGAQQAYYFFFALFPALLTLISVASFVPIANLIDEVVSVLGRVAPPDVQTIVADQIRALYHSFRGESNEAKTYFDRVELNAVQGAHTWQTEIFWPALLLNADVLTGDVMAARRRYVQLERRAGVAHLRSVGIGRHPSTSASATGQRGSVTRSCHVVVVRKAWPGRVDTTPSEWVVRCVVRVNLSPARCLAHRSGD